MKMSSLCSRRTFGSGRVRWALASLFENNYVRIIMSKFLPHLSLYLSFYRSLWSTWGPNTLLACGRTSRCMILSGKRELLNATLPAVCETIAPAVFKPQRRNARSVHPFSYQLCTFVLKVVAVSNTFCLCLFFSEYSGCVGEVAEAFQHSQVKWCRQTTWLCVPPGPQVRDWETSFNSKCQL